MNGATVIMNDTVKKTFDRVNHRTLAKILVNGNVALHIVKLFIFRYREQESVVR